MKLFEGLKKIFLSPIDQEVVVNKNSIEMQIEYLKQKGFLEENKKISLTFLLTGKKAQQSLILRDLRSSEYLEEVNFFEENNEIYISGKTMKKVSTEKTIRLIIEEIQCLEGKYNYEFLGWGADT